MVPLSTRGYKRNTSPRNVCERRLPRSEMQPVYDLGSRLAFAELPSQMPSIQGLKRKYRVGDPLRLNCTSGRSKPAANLTWYINDRQVCPNY